MLEKEKEEIMLEQRIEEEQRLAKANESSVRFLQLSLQLFFQWGYDSFTFLQPIGAFLTSQKGEEQEGGESHFMELRYHQQSKQIDPTDFYTQVVQPLCLFWTLFNLLLLLGLKCREELSRGGLITTVIINFLVALVVVILGFIQGATEDDVSREIYHRYAPFQVLTCLTVVSLFYFTKAHQPRRFSTSPGNFVWVWLFLTWSWAEDIEAYMLSIGLIYALITTTSVMMLVVELMKGLTTTVKKILVGQLIGSLILTALTQIFAVVSHDLIKEIAEKEASEMIQDDIAVSLLEIFMIVNIVDMVFWMVGRCAY